MIGVCQGSVRSDSIEAVSEEKLFLPAMGSAMRKSNPFPWLPFWPETRSGAASDEALKIVAAIVFLTVIFETLWFCLPD